MLKMKLIRGTYFLLMALCCLMEIEYTNKYIQHSDIDRLPKSNITFFEFPLVAFALSSAMWKLDPEREKFYFIFLGISMLFNYSFGLQIAGCVIIALSLYFRFKAKQST